MHIKNLFLYFVCFAMLLPVTALAEESPEDRIAQLQSAIAEKDTYIAQLESELESLRAQLGSDDSSSSGPAAEFDGGIITVDAAAAEYSTRSYYYQLFGVSEEDYADDLKTEVLRDLVEDAVLMLKAQQFGVYEPDDAAKAALQEQAQAQLDEMVDYYRAYRAQEGMSEDEITQSTLEYLAGEGYTLESLTVSLSAQAWRDRLYTYVTGDIQLTGDEFDQYCGDLLASQQMLFGADLSAYEYARLDGTPIIWNPEGIRAVRFILVSFNDEQAAEYSRLMNMLENSADEDALSRLDDLYTALEPVADDIRGQLEAGGDFLALMDSCSADITFAEEPLRTGGVYIDASSRLYPEDLVAEMMALQNPGDVTEPVRTENGLIIAEYTADVQPGAVSVDTVRDQLISAALQEKKDACYNETVEQWLSDSGIVYHTDRF